MVIQGEDCLHGSKLCISTTLSIRNHFLIVWCDKCLGKWHAGPNTSCWSGLRLWPPLQKPDGQLGWVDASSSACPAPLPAHVPAAACCCMLPQQLLPPRNLLPPVRIIYCRNSRRRMRCPGIGNSQKTAPRYSQA